MPCLPTRPAVRGPGSLVPGLADIQVAGVEAGAGGVVLRGLRAVAGVPAGPRAGGAAGGGASRLAGRRVRMAAGGVPHLILREVRHGALPEAEPVRARRLFRRGRRSGGGCRGLLHGSRSSIGSRPLAGRHDRRPRTAGNCKVPDGPLSVNRRSGTGRNNRIVKTKLHKSAIRPQPATGRQGYPPRIERISASRHRSSSEASDASLRAGQPQPRHLGAVEDSRRGGRTERSAPEQGNAQSSAGVGR